MMQMKREKEKNKKRFWVRKVYAERLQKGEFHLLVQDLRLHDQEYFFKYFRMSPTTYEELLSFVAPVIVKQRTTMRDPVSPSERLAVTLRFIVTGDAQCTIAASYRISASTISRIISETCAAIWSSLKERNYLHVPSEKQEWKTIAKEFENMWSFPHAIGAIDGKHIVMQAPHNSGSEYFNYKKTHSIVLLAVCNAKYEFTMVDIGDSGRQSDGSVFNNCSLGYAIENNKLNIPDPEKIGNSDKILPYVLVADDAFGLKSHMMKPYPNQNILLKQKIFNYRLSRARRVIENTFGIATSRFRIFRRPIIANLEKVILITQAIVALHNFLMKKRSANNYLYCPTNYTDIDSPAGFRPGDWRQDNSCSAALQPLSSGSNNYSKDAKQVRDDFKEYFNSPEGELEWQLDLVNRKS
ncbi:uncharacterized protein LOC136086784 [Hydra vulgaris]|uniref:Uncharacterized protein LOC136086784 n=1 Tax=Hydra vulgaris TaxID=6087 RepID=A0ABM4CTT2_HYDVU